MCRTSVCVVTKLQARINDGHNQIFKENVIDGFRTRIRGEIEVSKKERECEVSR